MRTSLNLIGVLMLVTAVANSTAVQAQQIAQDANSSSAAVSLEVVHTSASDSGGIPDSLKKYGKYLRRAGSENWKFHSRNSPKPVPGTPKTVNLPAKLGKAIISIDAKGVATVKILDSRGKSLGIYRSSRFPLVIANQRLRIDGKPYVLILDRLKKK
jgi:hypothetical protein